VAEIEEVALAEPSTSAAVSGSRQRWNAWAWVGLVASAILPLYRWWSWRGAATADHLFSTLSLLHASTPSTTLWWINSWAELVVPIAYVGALASRAVVAVRLVAAALVQVALFLVYRAVQRYVGPPWLEWWFYGAILVLVVAAVVVLRVGRVGLRGPAGARSTADAPFVGARSTAILSVLCGAVLLFLPAILFGEVVRSHADEDDTTSRRLAKVGTVLGALGLAIALGYLVATTQKID
jgi:hypothetical protein